MASKQAAPFDPKSILARAGDGQSILQCQEHQTLCTQGDTADAVFYVQAGWVKLTVLSPEGKEAVVAILGSGEFFGETCLAAQPVCLSTATSLGESTIIRIGSATMTRMLCNEAVFSERFMLHLVTRNLRVQEDVADQLLHSAEKRLARTLLLLTHSGRASNPNPGIPKVSQETLADMVGTTRSRVSFFMNRFKKLGVIEFTDGLHVHTDRLNALLAS